MVYVFHVDGYEDTELIAPLDCLMWDRRLIEALFGFAYKWEIYTQIGRAHV